MLRILLILILIISTSSCKPSQKVLPTKSLLNFEVDNSITNLIDEVVQNFPQETELAVAFTKGDSTSYYGAKNIKGEAVNSKNKLTLFEIGSISKVFTSHLLAESIQSGTNRIDQKIEEFFEFDLKDKKNITLEQLASHSSGLPTMPKYFFDPLIDSENPYKDYTQKIMLSDLESRIELDNESRDNWVYSNYGVSLLGYILAEQNKTSYEELLNNSILKPLGMDYTTVNRKQLKFSMAKGMTSDGNPTPNWDLNAITPAGGLISNALDLSKYSISCYSDKNYIFPLQSRKILAQPRKNVDQALGWMIYNRKDGTPYCYLHSGQTGGYASLILLQPNKEKSVIILSNISEEGNNILSLGFKLLKGLNEGKYERKK